MNREPLTKSQEAQQLLKGRLPRTPQRPPGYLKAARLDVLETDLSELRTTCNIAFVDELTDHAGRLDALETAVGALADAVREGVRR